MKLTKEERDKLVLENQDWTIKKLAEVSGWSETTIKSARRRLGLTGKHAKEDDILNLVREGTTPSDIANILGVKSDLVREISEKHGLHNFHYLKNIIDKYPTFKVLTDRWEGTKARINLMCGGCGSLYNKRCNELVTDTLVCIQCAETSKASELDHISILEVLEDNKYLKYGAKILKNKFNLDLQIFHKLSKDYKVMDSFTFLTKHKSLVHLPGLSDILNTCRDKYTYRTQEQYKSKVLHLLDKWEFIRGSLEDTTVRCLGCDMVDSISLHSRVIRCKKDKICLDCRDREIVNKGIPDDLIAGDYKVYIYSSNCSSVYKIGYSKGVHRRWHDVNTELNKVNTGLKLLKDGVYSTGLCRDSAVLLEEYLLALTKDYSYSFKGKFQGHTEFRELTDEMYKKVVNILLSLKTAS